MTDHEQCPYHDEVSNTVKQINDWYQSVKSQQKDCQRKLQTVYDWHNEAKVRIETTFSNQGS